jgi:hypothetical protein
MIRSYKKMQGMPIRALDGYFGKIRDVYFDDRTWRIQYFVAELVAWFSGKNVLVPPSAVSPFDGTSLKIELTKSELKKCPGADSALPVYLQRQYRERTLFNLASGGKNISNEGPFIVPPMIDGEQSMSGVDPHLRSCKNVSRYELIASDGDIGGIQDLLIDDSLWLIRFLIAKADEDGPEKLYGPQFIDNIEWSLAVVKIGITKNQAQLKPNFDATRQLDTSYEYLLKELYDSQPKEETMHG